MKKYPPPSPASEELNDKPLDLPIAPDFISHPSQIDSQTMLKRIAENMPWRKSRPGEAERRAAGKIDVEFVL